MPNLIGDIFSLNDVYERKTTEVDVAVVEVQAMTGLTITASSGTGTVATLTFATQTVAPFPVGSVIAVFGHVPLAYNGTYRVRTCTTTQVTYDSTATGVLTTGGTVLLVTESTAKGDFWTNLNSHGWFGGGNPTTAIVDRIDFSNDSSTASVRGPLSLARQGLSATGNSNYGWFGGGYASPTIKSTVDRIDFSNDSSTASVRGPLSVIKISLAATGNSNYGWFGGSGTPNPLLSTVDRIDFSNDSATASVRGPLSAVRYSLAATGNSNYGWFGGGGTPIIVSTVDRIDFSNDSATASVRGPLSLARKFLAATGNSNYGWFGGGTTPSPGAVSTVDRMDFSNDSSIASVRGPLSSTRYNLAATGNSNYGWFGSGNPGPGPVPSPNVSIVDRIDFSNDSSTASVRGPLSLAKISSAATSGQAKSSSIRPLKGGNFGWFGGGVIPSLSNSTPYSTVDRIDFSNDSSTALVRGPLSFERRYLAATGNSNYGWFGGGRTFNLPLVFYSTVDRIDFSNDSSTASVRGPLTNTIAELSGTGNSNYGWFAGGRTSTTYFSRKYRIDFSNDFVQTPLKLSFSELRSDSAATGNSNYGWFGGGSSAAFYAIVDRIDFSNDSGTASVRGPLSSAKRGSAATGNSNYGWFGGGYSASPLVSSSIVDRIDFSNDSATASVRGSLSLARSSLAATGNSNYGWFGGGYIPGSPTIVAVVTVDRIDFSNDSATASVRGPLSLARNSLAATSNTPVG